MRHHLSPDLFPVTPSPWETRSRFRLERPTGFEPATLTLAISNVIV
jgi:hypothetical protein